MHHTRGDFPDGFTFGVATSAYQIEGHQFGGAGLTHWDSFAATSGKVVRGEDGQLACDHYHLFEQDFDLVQRGGFDAYRFSTSWARVQPEGKGAPNKEGLDFYDRVVDALCARGIEPNLTLYHWELPQALADVGGWRNRDIPFRFADFAEIVMKRIGDRVARTATINEPWCVSWLGHFEGEHAPGLRDVEATARAMHHVLLAHGLATEAMRAQGQTGLGAVFNLEYAQPADDSEASFVAAQRYDAIYNRFFLSGVFKQSYPDLVLEGLGAFLPEGWQDDMPTIASPVDWCGINYYTRKMVKAVPGPWPGYGEVEGPLAKTQMGWEIYPDGLTDLLIQTAKNYSGDLPIYVTENGMASPDQIRDEVVDDGARVDYIDQHLGAVRRALNAGVPLAGYFVWSLLDNYEWAYGYEKRFGLVHVDFETLERTPKRSFHACADAFS